LFYLSAQDDREVYESRDGISNSIENSFFVFNFDPDIVERNDRFDKSTCLLINVGRRWKPRQLIDLL
jgi:hypothetical protein